MNVTLREFNADTVCQINRLSVKPEQAGLVARNSESLAKALFVVALIAFRPTYLSRAPGASRAYTHLHALTAALRMLILIVQPFLVRSRRLSLHRAVGRATYVVAPLVLLGIVLLANNRIRHVAAEGWAVQACVVYLQASPAALFAALQLT